MFMHRKQTRVANKHSLCALSAAEYAKTLNKPDQVPGSH